MSPVALPIESVVTSVMRLLPSLPLAARAALFAGGALLGGAATTAAQPPDLAANWIRGGRTEFNQWEFTAEGERQFKAYDFKRDDPAYGCIGASWTRVWLNPNVVVQITQAADHVRLRYEWMDIDRRVPLVDPRAGRVPRSRIKRMPALGASAAWYDGDTLVIDTEDFAPGYITTMEGRAGMPQSRRMRTVERLRRAGDVLTIETTHVDPTYYRTPVVTTIEYRKTDFTLMDYGCTPEAASLVSPR